MFYTKLKRKKDRKCLIQTLIRVQNSLTKLQSRTFYRDFLYTNFHLNCWFIVDSIQYRRYLDLPILMVGKPHNQRQSTKQGNNTTMSTEPLMTTNLDTCRQGVFLSTSVNLKYCDWLLLIRTLKNIFKIFCYQFYRNG